MRNKIRSIGALLSGFLLVSCYGDHLHSERANVVADHFPETADLGSYLAGSVAQNQYQIGMSATYYKQALEAHPENQTLQKQVYVLNGILARFDEIRPVIEQLQTTAEPTLLTDYALAVLDFKKKDYAAVQKDIAHLGSEPIDRVLLPCVKAWLFMAEGKGDKALKAIDGLDKKDGVESLYWYQKGLIYAALNQPIEADKCFEKLQQAKLPSVSALGVLSAFYKNHPHENDHWTNQYRQALSAQPILRSFLGNIPQKKLTPALGLAEAFHAVAFLFQKTTSPQPVLLLNAFALTLNPDGIIPIVFSAEVFEKASYFAQANILYDKLPFSNEAVGLKKVANCLALQEEGKAEKLLQNMLRQEHSQLVPLVLAELYQKQKRHQEVVLLTTPVLKQLQQVAEDMPAETARFYSVRGAAHLELRQFAQAESDFKNAQKLDPENPIILNNLGWVYIEQNKNLKQAATLIETAHQKLPDEPAILDSLAVVYLKQKQYDLALQYAEAATDLMPQSALANAHLGEVYEATGRLREARFQYKKALDLKEETSASLQEKLKAKLK